MKNLATRNEVKVAELPMMLRHACAHICTNEKIDISKVNFKKVDDNYFEMLEENKKTGFGYFIKENEID